MWKDDLKLITSIEFAIKGINKYNYEPSSNWGTDDELLNAIDKIDKMK